MKVVSYSSKISMANNIYKLTVLILKYDQKRNFLHHGQEQLYWICLSIDVPIVNFVDK